MTTLLEDLVADDAIGDLFKNNYSSDSYKTGIAPLDYMLGYRLNVFGDDDTVVDSYPSLGFNGGCYIMSIGKSSTAKTSTMLFIAGMIVRQYEQGSIIHYDLEQAMNMTRAKNMLKMSVKEMKTKYVLRKGQNSIEDIKKSIMELYRKKMSDEKYWYYSDKKDEFGNEIHMCQPTIVLIDSIPSLTIKYNENDKKQWMKLEEVTSQTERMRLTGEVGRMYSDMLPYANEANIILISINHIKVKADLGFVKSAAELLYLKQDESLPCGRATIHYSNYLLKNVAIGAEKFTLEEDGFDGFGIRMEVIKSRSNQAGRSVMLIYDTMKGISPVRTCVRFAKDNGLVGGNKNATYFIDNKEKKFPMKTVEEFFREHKEMYGIMYSQILPYLEKSLACVTPEEIAVDDELFEY